MFPVISANNGIILFLSLLRQAPAIEHGQTAEILMVRRLMAFFMRANQQREDGRQEHEYERLNQTNQNFQKVKRNRNDNASQPTRHEASHRFQHVFTGENIAVQTEAQGY